MKILFFSFLIFSSLPTFAQVSEGHINEMIQQMVRENVIPASEADKMRMRLKNISKEQWDSINAMASKAAARSPASVASANKIEQVNNIDLDGAQFKQIQEDLKKVIPEYKD